MIIQVRRNRRKQSRTEGKKAVQNSHRRDPGPFSSYSPTSLKEMHYIGNDSVCCVAAGEADMLMLRSLLTYRN